ncbi:class I SAM-dependent methyltransferase [Hymenobacter caeli]|uniref:Class I SAM-dependent methyltransferase n=1 Tax=Hymenobacter caeli TaxID=2735894 RepID=A0ABX2FJH5_9BACT|nr:class I SAM-dependent methyltransferase [Hymenobacter caeli]NRT17265.1 hypothetical protein [Hymenobacter caeli]
MKKFDVKYYRCSNCEFIQTEEPYWLEESYTSAITSLDIGLIGRNLKYQPIVEVLIKMFFKTDKKYVDYGGGYGMFVRMMRDKGFNFFRQDTYCENIFAKDFDVSSYNSTDSDSFELLTAFEVFEHLVNPIEELEKMLSYSSNIFFSTTLYPNNQDLLKWWYLIPETGQHVSLYSNKTLQYIAKKFDLHLYSVNIYDHLLTKKKLSWTAYSMIYKERFRIFFNKYKKSPESLLQADFNKISGISM